MACGSCCGCNDDKDRDLTVIIIAIVIVLLVLGFVFSCLACLAGCVFFHHKDRRDVQIVDRARIDGTPTSTADDQTLWPTGTTRSGSPVTLV